MTLAFARRGLGPLTLLDRAQAHNLSRFLAARGPAQGGPIVWRAGDPIPLPPDLWGWAMGVDPMPALAGLRWPGHDGRIPEPVRNRAMEPVDTRTAAQIIEWM